MNACIYMDYQVDFQVDAYVNILLHSADSLVMSNPTYFQI